MMMIPGGKCERQLLKRKTAWLPGTTPDLSLANHEVFLPLIKSNPYQTHFAQKLLSAKMDISVKCPWLFGYFNKVIKKKKSTFGQVAFGVTLIKLFPSQQWWFNNYSYYT